jgi:hypothetical protein
MIPHDCYAPHVRPLQQHQCATGNLASKNHNSNGSLVPWKYLANLKKRAIQNEQFHYHDQDNWGMASSDYSESGYKMRVGNRGSWAYEVQDLQR